MFSVIPWKPFCGALGAALVIASLTAGWQHSRANRATEKAKALEIAVSMLEGANKSNRTAIKSYQGAVASWRALVPIARPELAAQAAADRRELETLRAAADRAARESDSAKPQCAAVLAENFSVACPARAGRLRERAEGRGPN